MRPLACRSWRLLSVAVVAGLSVATVARGAETGGTADVAWAQEDPAIEREAGRRIEALIHAADAGTSAAPYAYEAADLGLSALWMAAARMNPDKPAHRAPLLLLAEKVATARRTQRELLRLYDPPAYRAFYTPEGVRLQTWLAAAMKWADAPPNMPRAMVLAAPDPTLDWLESLEEPAPQDSRLLVEILKQWGSLAAMGREYQYLPRLRSVARRLAESPTVGADETLLRAVLQFAGDVGCRAADNVAVAALDRSSADVRGAAVVALGKLKGPVALQALVDGVRTESNAAVQLAIAEALGRWPHEPAAGEACVQLYGRAANAEVRRAVLNAAGRAAWPDRDALLRRAFEAGEGSALIALALQPVPALDDALLDRLKNHAGPLLDPYLLDAVAVARVTNAVPVVADYLLKEKNIAMRLKYIAALETIGGDRAGSILLRLLDSRHDDLETEYLVNALGRLRHRPAVSALARMAGDDGVEIGIRVQAIWALGRMGTDDALQHLEALQQVEFKPADGPVVSEDLAYHYRLVSPQLLLARLRADPAATRDAIGPMFATAGPIEQTVLLAGLAEQEVDHPVIAAGFDSLDFSVFYMAITAARAASPAAYGPRVRRLAASPYIQALADVSLETWDLRSLLEEGWR